MAERIDAGTEDWPARPWLMAVLCALAGALFWTLVDVDGDIPALRQAMASFVAIATVAFVLTVERRRWTWAAAFAIGWGAVIALVGWFSASYNRTGEIFEWPFLSGVFAVLLAAPLFQTVRDEGEWRFPYPRLHNHAWNDAVIGAAGLVFTGITFLLAWLIAGLFDLIGIDLIKDLLQEELFGWALAGFAFGAAVGLLRERDRLVGTLQRLVTIVLSVLAPVLAAALILFLLSIPVTGLQGLWDGWVSATGLLLTASAGAILLANAVIGNARDERSENRIMRGSALVLVAVVAPLAALAGAAMLIRIGQYGWTPERIWGVIAVAVALVYGLFGWWAIWRGRGEFDDPLRSSQVRLAIALCGLALFLALPIVDFGAISARSQIARLDSGRIDAARFDWAAMAFDFGPAGRAKLRDMAARGPAAVRLRAAEALRADRRWGLEDATRVATDRATIAGRIRTTGGAVLTDELADRIARFELCPGESTCVLAPIDRRRFVIVGTGGDNRVAISRIVDLDQDTRVEVASAPRAAPMGVDIETARIEVRTVPRRQVFVDGHPVGDAFE